MRSTLMSTTRRAGAAILATGLAAGTLGVVAPPATAATGCEADCLPNVSVRVSPDRATFTTIPTASAHVAVRLRPASGGSWQHVDAGGAFWSAGQVTADTAALGLLKQETAYLYAVTATDTSGFTWEETGTFTTGRREVSVRLDSVVVLDDSDLSGPAALAGAVRIPLSACPTLGSLEPLTPTSSVAATSPAVLDLDVAGYSCSGVPATVTVRTLLADDDSAGGVGDCWGAWPAPVFIPTGFATSGATGCYEWTSGGASVSAPGVWDATGKFMAVDVEVTGTGSAGSDLDYVATGSASFYVTSPTIAHGTGAPQPLALAAASKDGALAVSWTRPADVLGHLSSTQHEVWWRPVGGIWSSVVVGAVSSHSITGLANGTAYEVLIKAKDAGGHPMFRTSTVATPMAATAITGAAAPSLVAAPGTVVTQSVSVTTGGTARTVQVQGRKAGSAIWTTYASVTTTAAGAAKVGYPVKPGTWSWRLVAPATTSHHAATGPVRVITSRSAIKGFATTARTLRRGSVVKDSLTVTPGAGRAVLVQYRKAGSTVWKTYATKKASSVGAVTVALKAFPGRTSWRTLVKASTVYGTSAVSGVRVLRGR
jgi:hypothetical protein